MKNPVYIAIFVLFLLPSLTASAQSGISTSGITQLINAYRYEEALKELSVIGEDSKSNGIAELLNEEKKRCRLGVNMMKGVEVVTFFDSIVVARHELFNKLNIGSGLGTFSLPENLGKNWASGEVVFTNDMEDMRIFAQTDSLGEKKLMKSDLVGSIWQEPQALNLGSAKGEIQDYPFLLSDGMTLYYAAQSQESLGGYDIFVTRYDPDSKTYLQPENIGMPFNSPANDYLYMVNEDMGVGLFVTDRHQPIDSVCIYYFIPSESRHLYGSDTNREQLRRAAMISSIAETQTDTETVEEARIRLQKALKEKSTSPETSFFFPINNQMVYTSLNHFRNGQARRIAAQWMEKKQELTASQFRLESLRKQYGAGDNEIKKSISSDILDLEKRNQQLSESISEMEKNMREIEGKTN